MEVGAGGLAGAVGEWGLKQLRVAKCLDVRHNSDMQLDTRAESRRLLGKLDRTIPSTLVKFILSVLIAAAVVYAPAWIGFGHVYQDLSAAGRRTLFILVLAALLWVSEAIPAFAVGAMVIGLQIALLGRPGGVMFAEGEEHGWQIFVAPWASPLIWLFLGGFVLAHGASVTGLAKWMAMGMLRHFGKRPGGLLAGCMGMTFVLSMFMSNTATAAMMLTVLVPVVHALRPGEPFIKGLFIGIPVAANLGGMGTIIGSPPNAIAVGHLQGEVNFLGWMGYGLPPGLLLLAIGYAYMRWRYRESAGMSLYGVADAMRAYEAEGEKEIAHWQRIVVMGVFGLTVTMWLTEALHGVPAAVTAIIPLSVFSVCGVLDSKGMRHLPWDVLLLIAGGLSLGVAVKESGLADWLAGQIPTDMSTLALVAAMAFLAVFLSNLMSNTATASILLPIAVGLAQASEGATQQLATFVIPVALACSTGMALPISTPPNAIAYASGKISARDLLGPGLLFALVGPVVAIGWCRLIG